MVSTRIHSLKYLMSTTLGCKYIGIKKSDFCGKHSNPFLNIKGLQHKVVIRYSD